MMVRGVLVIIVALLMLLASTASLSKSFPQVPSLNFTGGTGQNNIYPGTGIGYPIAGTGGFQIMPTSYLLDNVFHSPMTLRSSIMPLAVLPPFQVLFRGPTYING